MVFEPGGVRRVTAEMLGRHTVMLAADHPAEAREVAFCHIGVNTVLAIGVRMVDVLCLKDWRQEIPVRNLISRDDGSGFDTFLGEVDALGFAQESAGQGAPATLAQRDDDTPFARTVLQEPSIDAIFLDVSRADMAAEIGTVDLDSIGELQTGRLRCHRLTQLVHQHEGGLVLKVEIA